MTSLATAPGPDVISAFKVGGLETAILAENTDEILEANVGTKAVFGIELPAPIDFAVAFVGHQSHALEVAKHNAERVFQRGLRCVLHCCNLARIAYRDSFFGNANFTGGKQQGGEKYTLHSNLQYVKRVTAYASDILCPVAVTHGTPTAWAARGVGSPLQGYVPRKPSSRRAT